MPFPLSPPGLLTKTSMRNSSSTSPSSSLSSPSPAASCSTPGEGLGLAWDSVRGKAPALILCTLLPRVTDAAFNFLLVWYYCTLTIRESILINNGSRCAGTGAAGRVGHTGTLCLWEPLCFAGVTVALLQDQRLVGFPSLRVHVPVRSHADLVSDQDLSWQGSGARRKPQALRSPFLLFLPKFRPDGLMYQKFRNQFLSFSMYQSEFPC